MEFSNCHEYFPHPFSSAFHLKIHSCRLKHLKCVSFNNVMCYNLSFSLSLTSPHCLSMLKKREAEKISFNLWLTARAHPTLVQPFFCYLYTIIPKLMIKFGCHPLAFQDRIKFSCEFFHSFYELENAHVKSFAT